MPVFVSFCLAIAALVQLNSRIQDLLVSDFVLYSGLAVAIGAIIASFFNKLSEKISYDLFACSALLVWFAYWKPMFVKDSPIFFFFPVYFALLIAFVSLFFIGQRQKIDRISMKILQSIEDSEVVQPWFVMSCVLVSLYFENHFLQYPVMTTLLVIRFSLSACLKPAEG